MPTTVPSAIEIEKRSSATREPKRWVASSTSMSACFCRFIRRSPSSECRLRRPCPKRRNRSSSPSRAGPAASASTADPNCAPLALPERVDVGDKSLRLRDRDLTGPDPGAHHGGLVALDDVLVRREDRREQVPVVGGHRLPARQRDLRSG